MSWAGLLGLLLLPLLALAQVPDRVGRIAYLSGDVQFYAESDGEWAPAQLNAPVSAHNSLFAGADSRAEMRFGSTALTLDSQTQLNIHLFDDYAFTASVGQGSVSLRTRHLDRNEVLELMAPGASYRVLQDGRYRVDAVEDGSSVTVFAGAVTASVAGGTVLVEAGKTLTASGGGYLIMPARSSPLDAWAQQRDEAYRPGVSARYVSPYMTGYEDLDANGRWEQDPDYGMVWYPTTYVEVGWVPYRHGHWAFVRPWGWTWIDAAPWGFAPFHYGRWVQTGRAWAWTPGGYVTRPCYAPALVAFVGIGGVPTARGAPSVGWYPLPPWEHYRPSYTQNPTYLRNVNNFTVNNPPPRAWSQVGGARVANNQLHGMTVVSQGDFVSAKPVARSALSVPVGALTTAAPVAAPTAPPARPPVAESTFPRGPQAGAAGGGRHRPDGAIGQPSPPRHGAPTLGTPSDAGRSLGRGDTRAPGGAPSPGFGQPPGHEERNVPRGDGASPRPGGPPLAPVQKPGPLTSPRDSGIQGAPTAPGVALPPARRSPGPEEATERFPRRGAVAPSRSDSPELRSISPPIAPPISPPIARPPSQPVAPPAPVPERRAPSPPPQREGSFQGGSGGAPREPAAQPSRPVSSGVEMPRQPMAMPAPRPESSREISREVGREGGRDASPRPRGGEAGDNAQPRESRHGGAPEH